MIDEMDEILAKRRAHNFLRMMGSEPESRAEEEKQTRMYLKER